MLATYIEHLRNLTEIGVADDLVDRAEFEHDQIVGASGHTFSNFLALNQLGS